MTRPANCSDHLEPCFTGPISRFCQEEEIPRHPNFEPKGVIPACILPFHEDLKIDERAYRQHLRHTADVHGVSAITVSAHATEVASCSFEEQRRVLDVTMDEIGDRTPVVSGVYADGSAEAARIARMADAGGASALLVYTPYAAAPLARLSCCLTRRAYGLQSLD